MVYLEGRHSCIQQVFCILWDGTLSREATVAIVTSSKRKRQSSCWKVSRCRERSIVPTPGATIKTKKGLKKRWLFIGLISECRPRLEVKRVVVLTEFVA